MCEQLEGLCQGYNCTITCALLLLGKSLCALLQNGMHFGWLLVADTQTSPRLLQALEASADPLPRTVFCGSVAGCFSALTNMFGPCRPSGQIALGLQSRAAMARKVSLNEVRGNVRSGQIIHVAQPSVVPPQWSLCCGQSIGRSSTFIDSYHDLCSAESASECGCRLC